MSTTHTSLDAAAIDRKARLAKLAGIKRKQPGSEVPVSESHVDAAGVEIQPENPQSKTDQYLSGRNYDTGTKSAKLGFENAPNGAHVETLEEQADRIAAAALDQAAKDEIEAEKGIDLFKLQPKKPNWDLKRDLDEKMKVLNVRTQNAIARLVRERIENSKKRALEQGQPAPSTARDDDQGEEVGIEGSTLVEGIHMREQEEEREAAREKEEEDIPD